MQEIQGEQIKTAYKKSKDIYDDVLTQGKWWSKLYIGFFWGVSDLELADKLLSAIPDDFSGRILDVPVGKAVFTAKKYAKLKKAAITALDYSFEMIEQAKRRCGEMNLGNVRFMQGDVGELPFPDGAFDIVFSMNGFHVFPDKANAFAETHRVLGKGGELIGCFYIRGENKRSDFAVDALLARKGWFCPPFYTKDELEKELTQLYSKVELHTEKAMAYFFCKK